MSVDANVPRKALPNHEPASRQPATIGAKRNRNEVTLHDLKVPPGNRLEALKGNLAGFHSIRVNDRWRIVFRWTNAGPAEVAIVDPRSPN